MLDSLTTALGSSPWTYALIAAIVAGDAVLPIFPGETVVITGGILAAHDDLSIAVVVLAAVLGAMVGDNAGYGVGRAVGGRAAERLIARGSKARRRTQWAAKHVRTRGAGIVVVARFIPGGRTATTLAAGALDMAWPRFLRADATAAVLWAAYASSLGYFGGEAFRRTLWKPLLVSLAVGIVLAGAGELYRRLVLDADVSGDRALGGRGSN